MVNIGELVGKNIRAKRKKLGLSQTELGARAGLSLQAVNRIESGKRQPRRSNLEAIANALNCSVEDFYQGSSKEAEQAQSPSWSRADMDRMLNNPTGLDVAEVARLFATAEPAQRAFVMVSLTEDLSWTEGFPELPDSHLKIVESR